MTKIQYQTVSESNFTYGIDARSAETAIKEGWVKDLLNADVIGERVRKRVGYQGYSGNIPVRVTELEYISSGIIQLTLDSAVSLTDTTVDLTTIRSGPLVVQGRSSSVTTGAPFLSTSDHARWYPAFTVPTRKFFVQTAGLPLETLTVPASEHGISTTSLFIATVEATSLTNKSYTVALPHATGIDKSSFDLGITYQNSTGVNAPVYVYYKDETPTAGTSYKATLTHTGSGTESFTIPAVTHNLDNYNIIVSVQKDLGSTIEVVEAEVTISNVGTVTVSLTSGVAGTYYALLSATTVTNSAIGNVQAATTSSIVLGSLTSPWIFYGIYLEVVPGGDRQLVRADSIVYDDSAQTATLTFTNDMPTAANFFVFYDYGFIRSNRIQISDSSVTVNAVDSRPQLTIWGLDHGEIYGTTPPGHAGWTNHIDSYRSAGNRRVVAGLGGGLFSSRTYDEAAGSYLFPLLYPRLQARTDVSRVLGPLLWDTLDTPARTRGYITSSASGTGWGTVTSVTFDTGTGYSLYTLSLPSKAILDSSGAPTTLGAVISVADQLQDYLTVENMSYRRHNGTFRIRAVTDGLDQIVISVENPDNSTDYDDLGCGGQAGVFTDQIGWLSSSPFIPGDSLINAALGSVVLYNVVGSSGSLSVVSGVLDRLNLAGGLVTAGQRTSSLVPMRGPLPLAPTSVENMVRGDMLAYSEIDRLLRVESVNSDSDRTINIIGDTGTLVATVTMTSGDTSHVVEGGKVLLLQAGDYSGPQMVISLLSTTQFTIAMPSASTLDVSGATLMGGVIEVDEELTWKDSTGDSIAFFTERRWIPIEAPDDTYDLTPNTYIRTFSSMPYGNQDFLRSTTVVDNMYLTNYSDEVRKFDGTNVYRAGLPSWQPGLFITQDTSSTAKVVISSRSLSYTGAGTGTAAGVVTLSGPQDSGAIPIGSTVLLTGDTASYTVQGYTNNPDGTLYYIQLDRALSASVTDTGTVAEIATYRYYFRLNAVDANDNVTASAVTGYQDHVIQLSANAAICLKLVGLPAWDDYDYDRLEVEIYRTKQSLSAPFYRVTTLQMPFDHGTGYINYIDTFSDQDLLGLDTVSTALKGQELGIQWQEPLRAKYVTSIGNKLILANVRDYPQIDMQILADGSVGNATYTGKTFLFRSSNLLTGTTTNMVDTAIYEMVGTPTGTVSAVTPSTSSFSFTTSSATGAASGDWIYLTYSTVATTGRDLSYSGWWQIASITGTSITVNLASPPAATSYPNRYVIAGTTTNIPVLLGTDGNLGMFGSTAFELFEVGRRLSMAINASMRMTDTTLTSYSTFVPWLMARGGNDTGISGRVVIRHPRAETTFPEIQLPSSFSGAGGSFQIFVNDIRRVPSAQVSGTSKVFPSRILASYENYPEIMDNPISTLASESDSALDINSADGQEITGVIPFFGEAAFGAAQQSGVLVVFKTNSIYLVDLTQKASGNNAIQRIESEGLGCTAPYSIAPTKNGIMFANESGIYMLRTDQTIQFIGKYMDRNWTERVNKDQYGIIQGHHYGLQRMYKLSVPIGTDTSSSEVFVYNHTEEIPSGTPGAWSRYDNHPSTGWCNLDSDAFMASTRGQVFSLRRTGSVTDYRDSSSPVQFTLDTRAVDGGDAGIRKILDAFVIYYRVLQTTSGTSVSYSVGTDTEYTTTTALVIRKDGTLTGIDDIVPKDVVGILHNVGRRKGTHFQLRIQNGTLDENLEITGIALRLAGLSEKGILQASQTR